MPTAPLKICVTRRLPAEIEARMTELFDAALNPSDAPLGREELLAAAAAHDVLVTTLTDQIDAEFLEAAGDRLKLIANFGAGLDHIDIEAAWAAGVTVTNTPGVLTEDTADMTMALILAVPRRLVEGERALAAGAFEGWSPTWMLGHRIGGKNLGIIGMGRVGQAVARRARAFGLNVHYHNRNRVNLHVEEELQATYWESLDQMLARMDVVSVNCPHTPATFHLLSARRLRLLQPHAYVVNTARGEIIDEEALADLLERGLLAGAGLDVFEKEPAVNPKLLSAKNTILLPHLSSATIESRMEMGERVLINIRMFADGHKPQDRVIPAIL
ncbi:MAG: D-glycerate dehydrogenase [Pseudomonadota bacterium]